MVWSCYLVCMVLVGLEVKVDGMVMLPCSRMYGTCWVGG